MNKYDEEIVIPTHTNAVGGPPAYHLPLALTVEETAKVLRLGVSKTRELLRNGTIPHVRVGKQYRVLSTKLIEWLDS